MRRVSDVLPPIMARFAGVIGSVEVPPTRLKAFVVEGDRILHRSSRRWLTIEHARAMIPTTANAAIAAEAPFGEYHENELLDLVRAIREAESNDPQSPVAMSRAA